MTLAAMALRFLVDAAQVVEIHPLLKPDISIQDHDFSEERRPAHSLSAVILQGNLQCQYFREESQPVEEL